MTMTMTEVVDSETEIDHIVEIDCETTIELTIEMTTEMTVEK